MSQLKNAQTINDAHRRDQRRTYPTPITDAIAYWRQMIKDRNPDADAHNLLRNAAIDLRRILDIDRTVYPKSHAEAKQTAVDALNEMATDGQDRTR